MGSPALAVTAAVFLCGPAAHPPLLAAVIGRVPACTPARLADHALGDDGAGWAVLAPAPGSAVTGGLAALTRAETARLAFHAAAAGAAMQPVAVRAGAIAVAATVPLAPGPGRGAWDADSWARDWAATVTAAAGDVMAARGRVPAARLAARRGPMLVRAASRLRAAAAPAPAEVRAGPGAAAVEVTTWRTPYARFFAVEEYDLAVPRLGGGPPLRLTRAAFVSGDAVTVLPYDPVRDAVLLVEQFRAGPFARGDSNPWSLEAIAGRIDPGETPAQAARREAAEEAGIETGDLIEVASCYASPGAKTEFLYLHVALADLAGASGRIAGVDAEGEDIRTHVLPFPRLMALIASGEVANAPLILTAFWLEARRGALGAGSGGGTGAA